MTACSAGAHGRPTPQGSRGLRLSQLCLEQDSRKCELPSTIRYFNFNFYRPFVRYNPCGIQFLKSTVNSLKLVSVTGLHGTWFAQALLAAQGVLAAAFGGQPGSLKSRFGSSR